MVAAVAALALLPAPATALPDEAEGSAAGIRHRAVGFDSVPGGPGKRIVLRPEMVGRLGIETAPMGAGEPKAVPCDAVFYDIKGSAWIYVSRKPGVFTGQRVQVAEVADGQAILSAGPASGTAIVTVGTPALNGAGMFGRR